MFCGLKTIPNDLLKLFFVAAPVPRVVTAYVVCETENHELGKLCAYVNVIFLRVAVFCGFASPLL